LLDVFLFWHPIGHGESAASTAALPPLPPPKKREVPPLVCHAAAPKHIFYFQAIL
jgi:hypothetical protein